MDNLERKIERGSLYKLDKNLKLSKVDKNYRITNGPAFIDNFNFYHTDSAKGECFGPGNIALANKYIVEKVIQPLVIGEDPLNKEHIWLCSQ